MKKATKKRTWTCPQCGKPYGDCEHTNDYQILPKEESGRTISPTEFLVLVENGDI